MYTGLNTIPVPPEIPSHVRICSRIPSKAFGISFCFTPEAGCYCTVAIAIIELLNNAPTRLYDCI